MSWWWLALAGWLVIEVGSGVYLHKLKRRNKALKEHVEYLTRRLDDTRR